MRERLRKLYDRFGCWFDKSSSKAKATLFVVAPVLTASIVVALYYALNYITSLIPEVLLHLFFTIAMLVLAWFLFYKLFESLEK